jgi:hypothetical protein
VHESEGGEELVRVFAGQREELLGEGPDRRGVVTLLVNLAGQEQAEDEAEGVPAWAQPRKPAAAMPRSCPYLRICAGACSAS